jgi:hypothetical protein
MAFQSDEIADGEKRWSDQAKNPWRSVAVGRPEERGIDPIAQHVHTLFGDPEIGQPLFQPSQHAHRHAVPTSLKGASEQHRSAAVRWK